MSCIVFDLKSRPLPWVQIAGFYVPPASWAGNVKSRQQAIANLENDLDMTWRLAERMGVIP